MHSIFQRTRSPREAAHRNPNRELFLHGGEHATMMSSAAGVSSGGMNTSLHHTIRVLVATTGVTYKITLYPAELTYVRNYPC
jgi:hypothetical protein